VSNVKESLKQALEIEGAFAAALVDYHSGMTLGTAGSDNLFDLEIAAAGYSDLVRAELNVLQKLGISDQVEDIIVTLGTQYHLGRPVSAAHGEGTFVYLAISREKANLAMARRELRSVERDLVF
jgi:hypothetical protein